jgi:hypothetical protein
MRAPLAAVAVLALVAGCATESGGEPRSATPTAPAKPSLDVPPVSKPLDVAAFADDPCALLDESQRAALGRPDAVAPKDNSSTLCDLHADAAHRDPVNYLRVGVYPEGGLASLPGQCGTLDCSRWTTDTISGYPVIRANDKITALGGCKLYLGVADATMVVIADIEAKAGADGPTCDRADDTASAVLETLTRP